MRILDTKFGYVAPNIDITECCVEQGFSASNEGYGEAGEAGDKYDDIYNGIF